MTSALALPKLTDFEIELTRTNKDIASLRTSLEDAPRDIEKCVRLAYRLYHRASLSGFMSDYDAASTAIRRAIEQFGPKEDLCLLKANLDFRFHRLAEVRQDLEMAPLLAARPEGKALLADLDFQHGRYEQARAAYENLIEGNRTWDNLARLAYFRWKMGDVEGADRLYFEAEDELTVKEMRSYAWVELQRGVLDLSRGRYFDTHGHYERAAASYTGFWHVEEHIAELLAAEGKFDEAIAMFESIAERVPKPELYQTIGEIYVFAGRDDEAEPWYGRALAIYLESANRGEIHYFHHLTDFYSDVRVDPTEAVKWARKDIELRENFATQSALALALSKAGEHQEASTWITRALASGVKDAHLFAQASEIFDAAGDTARVDEYLRMARELNPKHENFHVHR